MTEELNRRHNLATMPTINNNGESYIVPFDIYKEGYDAYDISNWFKGRVGDNGTPFGIRWYKHGQLMDVTGMRPFIEGQVGDYTIDDSDPDDPKINMDSEASNVHVVGDVNDCQEYGVAIYRLINQAMPQSGIFYGKIGVMGTQDDGTTVMSSVDVAFKVLAGHMNMLGARKFYVSELEKAWLDLQAKIRKYQAEYKDATDKQAEQFKEDTEKALADLNTKIANEIKRAEDTLGDTQATIDANLASLKRIRVMIDSIQQFIDTNDVVRLKDYNQEINTLENKINHDLSNISPVPLSYANLDAVKQAYPQGTTALIVTDDGHRAVYRNGQWQDGGLYNAIAVGANSIDVEQLSSKSLDTTAPNLFSEDSPNLVKGGFHKDDGIFQKDTSWGEFSLGVQKGEIIAWNQTTWYYTLWNKGEFVKGFKNSNSYTKIVIPDGVDTLKLPVFINGSTDEFDPKLFCVVRGGENIPFFYPQNNVLDKFYVPLKNASHQLGYGRIIAKEGKLNIIKKDASYYLVFPESAQVFYGSQTFDITNNQNEVLLSGIGKNQGTWLYYNPISEMIETYSQPNISDSLINLGVIYDSLDPNAWHLNTKLNIDFNDAPFTSLILDKNNLSPDVLPAFISGTGQIEIDMSKKTMIFNHLYVSNSSVSQEISSDPIDISKIEQGAWLYFDSKAKKVTSSVDQSINSDCISIGSWWAPLTISINGNPNIYIDGVKYNSYQPLRNYKLNVLGDSITHGINTSKPYVDDLKTVTGADICRNYGVPSSTIARRADDSIAWDTAEPFVDRFDKMDADANMILIFGGVNDWVTGRNLGTPNDQDATTFYGSLNTILAGLRSKYVGATIALVTPLKTDYTTRTANEGKTDGTNSIGLKLDDYVKAEKELANKFAVPVLDLFNTMFYPFNSDFKAKYMTDSLHPTRLGHILLANRIGKFLNTLA